MKLADLYHQIRARGMAILRLGRYNPATSSGRQAIAKEIERKAIRAAQHFELPDGLPKHSESPSPDIQTSPSQTAYQPSETHQLPANSFPQPPKLSEIFTSAYPQYQCKTNDPLGCHFPQETLKDTPQAKFCRGCGFPVPLAESLEIRGRRGIYQITSLLGKRGIGRLYLGLQKNDNQPLVLKEFLLPSRCFPHLEDVQQRQATFVRVANLTSADGKERDFRLLIPWEAIADEQERRCYLVTKGNLDTLPTLRHHLNTQGVMTEQQIRILLDQILQTLEFLHGQRFQLASGQIQQGLVHGNLSLDSVLIHVNQEDFFVYLTDLILWEYLFVHPEEQIEPKTVSDDLTELGKIAFTMLVGTGSQYYQLDPRNEQHWPPIQPELKEFILQLIDVNSPFKTATAAREALLKLPKPKIDEPQVFKLEEDTEQKKKFRWWLWLLAPSLLILVIIIGNFVGRIAKKERQIEIRTLVPFIQDINVPPGQFTYTTEKEGTGSYVLEKPGLLSTRRSLIDELEVRNQGLQLNGLLSKDEQEAIQKVQQEIANFAVVSQAQEYPPSGLISEKFAYDGILIIVPFSYEKRDIGIPKALGGQISFDKLRQLYTGKITNWKELGGPNIPVKLYIPPEPVAREIFEKKVLQDQESIAIFRDLINRGQIEEQETIQTIRNLQSEFENQSIGGVSFGLVSKIFGQCGGYPLALKESDESPFIFWVKRLFFLGGDEAVQTWVQPSGKAIDPGVNLCKKGSYSLAEELFQAQEYPLSFPVVVLYPRNNQNDPKYQIGKKFAEMLTTEEGQRLLRETNLIPLQPVK